MGNAGRNGGEYYTPRPLIRAMIQVIKYHTITDALAEMGDAYKIREMFAGFQKHLYQQK